MIVERMYADNDPLVVELREQNLEAMRQREGASLIRRALGGP
jgi:hypothetical protein